MLMKPAATARSDHDGHSNHSLLLDLFLRFRRNRGGPSVDRSGATAASREAKYAGRVDAQSTVAEAGAPARHGSAYYKYGGHSCAPPAHATAGLDIRLYGISCRADRCIPDLSFCARRFSEIAFSPVSLSSAGGSGRPA